MVEVFRFALLGLGIGGIYALAAQGIVLVYRGSGVLNFAHGALALVGAYTYVEALDAGWPTALAIVVGVLVAGAAGGLIHLAVMRPLRHASPLTRLVATLGVLVVLQSAALLRYGNKQLFVSSLLPSWEWKPLDGAAVGIDRIWLLIIACGLTALLWAVYRFTRFGLVTTAVSESQRAAAALGRSPDLIAGANWIIGAGLAGLAGILVVPITGLSVLQLTLLVIPALAAALVGGFSSFPLTLAGGVAIGIAESEMARYVTTPGWSKAVPFLIIIGVLVIRGKALPLRSHVLERLPAVGTGRVRLSLVLPAVIAVATATTLVHANWVNALTTTLITATICLSLVVVTGYAGQLSLAQFALAGVGAFVAARVSDTLGLPFPLALLVGVLATIPVGVLIGLPALRTRGVNLAIATLGLALVIERVVLGNAEFTGGFEGTVVDPPQVLGYDIDPTSHPSRYAIACLVLFTLAALAVANMRRGRSGRRLLAVRDNERAAASLGISVVGAKLYAFGLGASIAGLGGILLAFRTRNVVFSPFSVFASINAVVFTVIGGIGFVAGGLLGAMIATGGLLSYMVSELTGWERYIPLVSGVLLIVTLIQAPNGTARQLIALSHAVLRRIGRDAPATGDLPEAIFPDLPPTTLEVRDLRMRFGGVVALSGVSLVVHPGEVVGLIGPNGAGKTTLIDNVSGLTRGYTGSVLVNGVSIDNLSPSQRSRAGIGRTFQSLELFEDMTVRDNIRTAADPRDWPGYLFDLVHPRNPPLPAAAIAALREFGLMADLDRRPDELPYGRRRLVGIARAVAGQPSVLLLDEPAAGLDEHETAELGDLLRRLTDEWGMAVLLVEHDVAMVMAVCDRIVALDFGNHIADGTPDEIRRNDDVIASYLGSSALATVASGSAGVDA